MKSRKDFESEEEYLKYLHGYLVALAMQGMVAAIADNKATADELVKYPHRCAVWAMAFADSMIYEIKKEGKDGE
jgi:hypothetical protein